jgi:hypothetical protein
MMIFKFHGAVKTERAVAVGCSARLCEKSVMFFETFTPEDGLIQA